MSNLKRLYNLVRDILLTSDTRPAVLGCILSAYVWGFVLLLPEQVLYRPYYAGLLAICKSEIVWGFVFVTIGTAQLHRMFSNAHGPFITAFEYSIRLFACVLWTYIMFTAAFQSPVPPVLGDTIPIMAAAWWDFFRYTGKDSEKALLNTDSLRE